MWCKLISGIYETRGLQTSFAAKAKFYPGAAEEEIADAETRLNATFPTSLRSLLLETNGVMEMMAVDGGEWFDSQRLVWTVAEIIEENLRCRAKMPDGNCTRDLGKLVFFAGAGCDGILFGFPIIEDCVCAPRVVVWHPMRDDVAELVPSLEDFFPGWLTGTIAV